MKVRQWLQRSAVAASATLTSAAIMLSAASAPAEAATVMSARSSSTTTASVLLARVYADANYQGASKSFYGTHGCTATTADVDFVVNDLTKISYNGFWTWNDRVSSVLTYNRCDIKLHDNVGRTGASTPYLDSSSNLTSRNFNDRASSLSFS